MNRRKQLRSHARPRSDGEALRIPIVQSPQPWPATSGRVAPTVASVIVAVLLESHLTCREVVVTACDLLALEAGS
jgi:hypothetical protein